MNLSNDHIKAIERRRRIIFQDDVLANDAFRTDKVGPKRLNKLVDFYMSRLDPPNQIDSVWHEWGEGNTAVWPSEVIPQTENVFPLWWDSGIDPVDVLLQENKKRGREVFFSYRINGSDNDPDFDPPHDFKDPIPFKAARPEWMIQLWHAYWDFTRSEVRDLKLNVLREVATRYDYDGISVDFARIPVLFPEGTQWERRDLLTDYMCQLRSILIDIGSDRGRPYLLAARVPEDLAGCHFDGIDVETWVRESLVDILVVGARTANADVAAYRRLTTGTPIRIYPSWDDHHSSDGYRHPSLRIYRGVFANWWRHDPDGVHTFNLMSPSPETKRALGIDLKPRHRGGANDELELETAWNLQCHVFNEIGSCETLYNLDKIFYVERRGGGHGTDFTPSPNNWHTPRLAYFQTNMRAPLPVNLLVDGSADALFTLDVADDVNACVESIGTLSLRLALTTGDDADHAKALPVEVRINNLLLPPPKPTSEPPTALNASFKNWLAYDVEPRHLAPGPNLIGVRLVNLPFDVEPPVRLEKIELHVTYKRSSKGDLFTPVTGHVNGH